MIRIVDHMQESGTFLANRLGDGENAGSADRITTISDVVVWRVGNSQVRENLGRKKGRDKTRATKPRSPLNSLEPTT